MKKSVFYFIIVCLFISSSFTGCNPKTADHKSAGSKSQGEQNTDTAGSYVNDDTGTEPTSDSANDPSLMQSLADAASAVTSDVPTISYNEYPYDITDDKNNFADTEPDITVGDKHYMTQINDWYINFDNYDGKIVEIEGMYLDFGEGYKFVGRNGPSCPYCTGGYVDFEFQTDEDTSSFIPGETWISVKGILREGHAVMSDESTIPFYYIEALSITELPEAGIDPISD